MDESEMRSFPGNFVNGENYSDPMKELQSSRSFKNHGLMWSCYSITHAILNWILFRGVGQKLPFCPMHATLYHLSSSSYLRNAPH